MRSPRPPIFSIPIRQSHIETPQSSSPCGEVHVIVGPMFAGKTTTLLHRIQAESNNGRGLSKFLKLHISILRLEDGKLQRREVVMNHVEGVGSLSRGCILCAEKYLLRKCSCFIHWIVIFSKLTLRTVAVIKSNKDTRYGLDSIVTHDGMKLPCWALANLSSFRQKIGPDAYDQLAVIGIDEAQFFEDLYDFCCEAADHDGKTVIVAGLDGDYLRRSFGSVLNIIPLANSVTKLTARCELCGKQAFFTLRKTNETETELIGGAEVYMPVCRQHYVDGQVVIGAARSVLESKKLQCGTCA
ncbi:hypothetical protein Gotri_006650 [Gossypium trilobum]|uniref:Thymidine kinase n=1 Tax=Gossypium trilobum TaxID=34281 RepID=A0A7J9F2J7_9ROSI|nr:hypothetical protein [Gossypium trilobum]